MTSSVESDARCLVAVRVEVADAHLRVFLADGRGIAVPLSWYPRLCHGTSEEQNRWELLDGGRGISWPDLDEDIAVRDLLDGIPSGESARSLGRWLQARKQGRPLTLYDLAAYEESDDFRNKAALP